MPFRAFSSHLPLHDHPQVGAALDRPLLSNRLELSELPRALRMYVRAPFERRPKNVDPTVVGPMLGLPVAAPPAASVPASDREYERHRHRRQVTIDNALRRYIH